MDRTALKILNNELTFIGDIEDYISFYFVRSFFQAKDFQLIAPIKYIDILKKDNYIYLNKYKSMIIEKIEINENKEQIIVKGRDIKSIIERRIIIPPKGEAYDKYKGAAEDVIKHYVDVCCVNPVDTTRKIPNLIVETNKNRGLILGWESRYKNLASEIESIALSGGVGWFVYLDTKAKKFIFEVEVGVNRIANQNINSRVIFSSEFGNMSNAVHTVNSVNYKNIAYVGGQGEGIEREIKEVKKIEASGLDRREIFIDGRDISESNNLEDRGLAKLSQCDYTINTESTVTNRNLLYERDWNLGDIVTIKNRVNTEDLRITEVREVYEGKLIVEIGVGTIENTLLDQITNDVSSIPNESGTIQRAWYPTVNINGDITWESKTSLDRPTPQNIKGPKGDIGPIGPQGIKGDIGPQGVKGDTGERGPIGPTGPKGDKGEQGVIGPKGEAGAKGDIGPQGPIGLTGPKGDTGERGPQGIQGVQGPAGNGQSYVVFHQYFIATQDQTVFSWNDGYIYPKGINAIRVYLNGVRLTNRIFNETNGNSITFKVGLNVGDKVFIEAMQAVVDLQGPKGDKGEQGPQGIPGAKGDTGTQGPRGIQGEQGPIGLMGPQGVIGPNGATFTPTVSNEGVISWNNDKGLANPVSINIKGPKGDQGIQGPQGPKGEQGLIGPQGIHGIQGLKGEKGDTGLMGPQGAKGDKGDTGTQGTNGFTWRPTVDVNGNLSWTNNGSTSIPVAVNIRGPQGVQGIPGAKGDKGDVGGIGPQGPKGETGERGLTGAQGAQGPKGNTGDVGPQGIPGSQGAQGPQGIKGDTGAQGPQGIPGKDGTQIITSASRPSGQVSGRVWIQLI